MKVLIVHDVKRPVGGGEVLVDTLAKKLKKRGNLVEVYYGAQDEGNNLTSFIKRVYNLKHKKDINELIESFNPDIIHIHGSNREISLSPNKLIKDIKIPYIKTFHTLLYYDPDFLEERSRIYALLKKIKTKIEFLSIKRNIDYFTCPSNFLKSKMEEGFPDKKIYVVPNGVDIPKSTTNHQKNILFVGRISKEKGLQTIAKTPNEIKSYKILVLGEGTLKQQLESQYKNIGFLGFQNPNNYYKNASILVYPSLVEESFGLSIAEAMSYGMCVVASNIGAIPELIQHMKTGLLFEPGNEKDFQEKFQYLLDNPSEIKRMGKNAKEFVKRNFDWNKTVKEYEKVYKEVIEEFKKKKP